MPSSNTIQHLKRNEIDVKKWDECVDKSPNGLIYANSYYLDTMCENWEAFIIDDYSCIMGLPWKKKAGIKYAYAAPFVQQLGVIGNHQTVSYQDLVGEIKKTFKYGDIFFNYSNFPPLAPIVQNTNFVLDIHKSYDELEQNFSTDLKKNLKQARKNKLFVSADYSFEMAIQLFRKYYQARMPYVTEDSYKKFTRLCNALYKKQMVLTRAVLNNEKEILAIALLLKDNKRIYNLMNTTTMPGRKLKANHFLINEIIKEFSHTNLLFDFEGSDLAGVKEFYQNFGPANQPYFHYHFNFLPFPLNLAKK